MRHRIVTQKLAALGRRPEFWLACLLAWLLLSACRSLGTPWARAALTEASRWGIGIGLALTLSTALHRTGTAARILTGVAGLLVLAGMWDGFRPERGGVVGPYQDHQLYGSALLVLLSTALALSLSGRDTRWRFAAQAIASGVIVCLLLSQTRSAWAGLLVSVVVFGWLWLNAATEPLRRTAVAVCAAVLLLGIAGVWGLTTPEDLQAPLSARTDTLTRLGSDESWQTRLLLWRGAAKMVVAAPLAGSGLGRYAGSQWSWTHQGRPLSASQRPSLSEQAHDLYLQTAAETGLIGLLLYGATLVSAASLGLHRLRRKRGRRPGSRDALVIAFLSMLAGQAVDALASPSWQFAEVSLLFWTSFGLGLAAIRRRDPEPIAIPIARPIRRVGQFALSGAVAVVLAAQILPLGLLSPVEAYSPPTGWTLVNGSTTLTGSTQTASVGDTVTYTLQAQYKDAGGVIHTVNVSADSTAGYYAYTTNPLAPYGTFVINSGAQNASYTVPASAIGQNLIINGSFKNGSLKVNVQTTLNVNH